MSFEYVPGTSFFHNLDPRTKFFFFVVVFIISETFDDPFILFAEFITIFVIGLLARIPSSTIARLFRNMIPIFIMLYVLNVLWWSPPRANVLFYLLPAQKWLPFSYEAMVYSAGVIFRFANVLIALWVIMLTTPISRFVLGFVKWKLPPSIAMGIGIGLASIPVLSQEMGMVLDAMKSRAWEVEYKNPIKKIRAYIPFFVPILYQTITRAENIAVAIESRAFGFNIAKRTYWREEKMTKSDYLVWIVGLAVTIVSLAIGVYGLGYGQYDFLYRMIIHPAITAAQYIVNINL